MKTYLQVLSVFLTFQVCSAQYWYIPNDAANRNPGDINADAERPSGGGLPAGWTTILNPNANPVWSTNRTLPFAFKFNNQAVTNYKISNSGILTFDVAASTVPGFTRFTLPNAAIPNNSICLMGMVGTASNDVVVTKVFGTAPNRQFWIQFNSYGYGTVPSDNANFAYWSIVLEETSNRIHIVDQRTGGYASTKLVSIGVQIDNSTATMIAGSPAILSKAGTSDGPLDNVYYTFVQGNQGKYDVTVTDIITSPYQVAGNILVTAIFRNLGTTPITSLRMNYLGDNVAATGDVKSGLNIPKFGYDTISHIVAWNINSGSHNLDVFADNLNGSNADENPVDDQKRKKIFAMVRLEPRVPLFEVYSSSTCAPCRPANERFLSITENKNPDDFVSIKFQQNFPGTGDPYATTEAVNRRGYYFISSIPRLEIDGGWDKNGSSFSEELFSAASQIPAFYTLDGTYKIEDKKVTANVNYSPLFDAAGARLYVAILEKITYANVASNQETEFHHVMKKMIPNEQGTVLPTVPALTTRSNAFSYTFNGEYRLPPDGQTANIINHQIEHSVEDFKNLYVVAWVQGSDKQVFQAANLKPEGTTAVNNVASFNTFSVYPNPSSEHLQLDVEIHKTTELMSNIVDNAGNIVLSRMNKLATGKQVLQYNIQNLPAGEYHLMIVDENNNSSVHEFVKR
ncbi:MAG: hypothetical protein HOP11_13935 [Saprospiraceae bacterium]|nr:hypothetical protein [Saprospiraceae bacterium]